MRNTAPQLFYMRQLNQLALAFSIATALILMAVFAATLAAIPHDAPAIQTLVDAGPAQTLMETEEDLAEVACVLEF